eukprot:700905_1
MLVIVACALLIVVSILSIHYCQHFKLIFKTCNSTDHTRRYRTNSASVMEAQFNMLRTTPCQFRCCLTFVPVDDEEFDFFPVSFLFYLVFMTALFLMLVIAEILHITHHAKEEWHQYPLFTLQRMNAVSIIDYILVYSTMMLFIWVSLFAFYRYYTTFILMQTMQRTSNKPLFIRFSVFAILFCILFILQIHVHYYLWSLVILVFCAFNWYCNYMFSKILITKIRALIDLAGTHSQADAEMLSGVIFTKNTSLICCALQSINLCVFVMTYNVNTLYYLSLLWSISAFILGSNFVRNRKWMARKVSKCTRLCTRRPKDVKTNVISSVPKPQPFETPKPTHHTQAGPSKTPPAMPKSSSLGVEATGKHKIKSKPPLLRALTDPMAIDAYAADGDDNEKVMTLMDIESGRAMDSEEDETSKLEMQRISPEYIPPSNKRRQTKSKVKLTLPVEASASSAPAPGSVSVSTATSATRRQKALELLGIVSTPKTPGSQTMKMKMFQITKPDQIVKKQTSETISTTIGTRDPGGLKKQITASKSTYVTMESDEDSTPTPGPTPLTVGGDTALDIYMTPAINEEYLHYTDDERKKDVPPHPETLGKSHSAQEEQKYDETTPQGLRPPTHHAITHSAPAPQEENHHEAFLSMDMLAKYGFCDKTSITSAKQLREYQRKSPHPTMATLDEEEL